MKRVALLVMVLVMAGSVWGQERFPEAVAQRIAKLVTNVAAKQSDVPLAGDVDVEKACAVKANVGGAMVVVTFIPVQGLSEETLAKAGKEVVPVGQMAFFELAPWVDGKAIAKDRLRVVKFSPTPHVGPLLWLGVRKGDKDGLVLVAYSKDKKPLLELPLEKADAKQDLPVEVDLNPDRETATLMLKLLGKHQATLTVGPLN